MKAHTGPRETPGNGARKLGGKANEDITSRRNFRRRIDWFAEVRYTDAAGVFVHKKGDFFPKASTQPGARNRGAENSKPGRTRGQVGGLAGASARSAMGEVRAEICGGWAVLRASTVSSFGTHSFVSKRISNPAASTALRIESKVKWLA